MSISTIRVDGQIMCWVRKRAALREYEISFPQEETLKSLFLADISEVHRYFDREYGVGEWVAG